MLLPSVTMKCGTSGGRNTAALCGRCAIERAMNALRVVIVREFGKLSRRVQSVPEEYPIKIFTPDRSNQPFDEGMRDRDVRNRLDHFDLEDAQVGEPAVKPKEWVVIGADMLRYLLAGGGMIEHPTHRYAVDVCMLDRKTDNATSEHVHDQQHPMAKQEDRFAAE